MISRTCFRRAGLIGILALVGLAPHGFATEAEAGFQVIVHPSVAGKTITKAALADIFMGKAKRWGDGRDVLPVDLTATSPVREAFSRACLGLPTEGVRLYWMRRIAAGAQPPFSRKTDEDVIAYVATHPGAVGYVAEGLALPETVKAVAVTIR